MIQALEEEHIIEDGEIMGEEQLIIENQFTTTTDKVVIELSTDSNQINSKQYVRKVATRQNHSTTDIEDDLGVSSKDDFIESNEDDPLSLEQICDEASSYLHRY